MSSTGRVLNRALLLFCGLLLAASGTAAILTGTQSGWLGSILPAKSVGAAATQVKVWATGLPEVGGVPGAVVVGLAVAVLLTLFLVVFLCTRGARRATSVLDLDSDDGHVRVHPNVADAVLTGALGKRADVLSAHTGAHRVKGAPAISLVLTIRRGANLSRVLSATEDAVQEWDALAGARVPVMVHLSDRSWLDGLRSATRLH